MRACLMLAMLCAAGSIHAADRGLYLGAGKSRSTFHVDGAFDRRDRGFKVTTGLQLQDRLDLELSYADHGRATLPSGIACIAVIGTDCPVTSNLSAKNMSAFAVGYLDLAFVSLLGKAGFSRVSSKLRAVEIDDLLGRDKRMDFAWGLGAQLRLGKLAIRGEYERFRIIGDRRLGSVSVSFLYTFADLAWED